MSNIKLLNENSVEIAKLDSLLKGVCDFLDTVFEQVETDDPQLKLDIMGRLEAFLKLMGCSIDLIKLNNNLIEMNHKEIIRIEEIMEERNN